MSFSRARNLYVTGFARSLYFDSGGKVGPGAGRRQKRPTPPFPSDARVATARLFFRVSSLGGLEPSLSHSRPQRKFSRVPFQWFAIFATCVKGQEGEKCAGVAGRLRPNAAIRFTFLKLSCGAILGNVPIPAQYSDQIQKVTLAAFTCFFSLLLCAVYELDPKGLVFVDVYLNIKVPV